MLKNVFVIGHSRNSFKNADLLSNKTSEWQVSHWHIHSNHFFIIVILKTSVYIYIYIYIKMSSNSLTLVKHF